MEMLKFRNWQALISLFMIILQVSSLIALSKRRSKKAKF